MDLPIQIFMGVGLAAAAGFRAFLPLLAVGLMVRSDYLEVLSQFDFLARTDVLLVLATATVVEFAGDKIPLVDNALDVVGTAIRPVAGTVLASGLLLSLDPWMATALGLATGGTTALAVHGSKAAVRGLSTATIPAHGGLANVVLSFVDDFGAMTAIALAVLVPVVAFVLALVFVVLGFVVARRVWSRRKPANEP